MARAGGAADERLEHHIHRAVELAVLVLVSTDWPWGILQAFWVSHGPVTSVVAGLLLLLLASAVIQRWLERREERRWEKVASTAFLVVPSRSKWSGAGQRSRMSESGALPVTL
jgi:hypothetical protein